MLGLEKVKGLGLEKRLGLRLGSREAELAGVASQGMLLAH
jgi:hypothetical protein